MSRYITISRILTGIATVLAVIAGISSFLSLGSAGQEVWSVEMWRVVGYFTFALFFLFLTIRPNSDPWIWIILVLNKSVLALIGWFSNPSTPGISDIRIWDTLLAFILIAAFVFMPRRIKSQEQISSPKRWTPHKQHLK